MSGPNAPVSRPFGVTLVVILGWISAILSMAAGVFLIFNANNPEVEIEMTNTSSNVATIGWITLGFGILTAILVYALGKGSNAVRILLTIVLVLRILGDTFLLAQHGSQYLGVALGSILVNLIFLGLLWTSRASAFFKQSRV